MASLTPSSFGGSRSLRCKLGLLRPSRRQGCLRFIRILSRSPSALPLPQCLRMPVTKRRTGGFSLLHGPEACMINCSLSPYSWCSYSSHRCRERPRPWVHIISSLHLSQQTISDIATKPHQQTRCLSRFTKLAEHWAPIPLLFALWCLFFGDTMVTIANCMGATASEAIIGSTTPS